MRPLTEVYFRFGRWRVWLNESVDILETEECLQEVKSVLINVEFKR